MEAMRPIRNLNGTEMRLNLCTRKVLVRPKEVQNLELPTIKEALRESFLDNLITHKEEPRRLALTSRSLTCELPC